MTDCSDAGAGDLVAPTAAPMLEAELALTRAFVAASHAGATRRAYQSDWLIFEAWCRTRGLDPLPAAAVTLAAFLAAEAAAGRKPASLVRRLAAIRHAHRQAGLPAATDDGLVRATLQGIRRAAGAAPARKAPATADVVRAMIRHCPDTMKGRRDRALILIGFAGAFRRSELSALELSDLNVTGDGLRVRIRRSKTDPDGLGQEIAIPHGNRLRPVAALTDWLAAAGIVSGAVFRPVSKGGRVAATALSAAAIATIVKDHAAAAGYDPDEFAGHSLRAGFLTSAAEAGASVFKMKEVSRHKTLQVLEAYVRQAGLFTDHAGKGFL